MLQKVYLRIDALRCLSRLLCAIVSQVKAAAWAQPGAAWARLAVNLRLLAVGRAPETSRMWLRHRSGVLPSGCPQHAARHWPRSGPSARRRQRRPQNAWRRLPKHRFCAVQAVAALDQRVWSAVDGAVGQLQPQPCTGSMAATARCCHVHMGPVERPSSLWSVQAVQPGHTGSCNRRSKHGTARSGLW